MAKGKVVRTTTSDIGSALTDAQIQKLIQDVQAAAQQAANQVLQAAQQTGGSLAADSKILSVEKDIVDINVDEAFKSKTYVDSELWTIDKKLLVEREQASAQKSFDFDKAHKEIELAAAKIELARKQSDFSTTEQLRAIAVSEAQQAANFKHLLNLEYAKFNAAVSEPINPNIGAAVAAAFEAASKQ